MLSLSGVRVISRLLSVSLFLFYIIVGFGQKLVSGSFFTNKNYLKCTLKEQNNGSYLLFELKNKHGKEVFKLQLSEKDLGY